MSYILDALRRADAERERDPARGIHAQPAAGLAPATRRVTPAWAWGAALAALAIAGGAWWMAQRTSAAPILPVVVASRPMVDLAVPAPVLVPVAASVSPPAPAPLPAPLPAPVLARPAAKAVDVAAAPVKAVPAVAGAPAAPAAVAQPALAAVAPVPPAASERIVAVGDLPADVQRELPKLVISGGVHSENASQRLLVVGGQVMTEGAEVAPGVMLEQIRARTAVMRYRGFKYSVPY